MEKQEKNQTAASVSTKKPTLTSVNETASPRSWEDEQSDQLVAALRTYFLTHTLDPLTGEVHTLH